MATVDNQKPNTWFIELHLLDAGTPLPLIYGYAQPTERPPRPWHAEHLPSCRDMLVARSNLDDPDFAVLQQSLPGSADHPIIISSPKRREIAVGPLGLVRRPPTYLRPKAVGYEMSPTRTPARCTEFWNLDKATLIDKLSGGADRLATLLRLRTIAQAINAETGLVMPEGVLPRLGNFEIVEPVSRTPSEFFHWNPATTPGHSEVDGITIELSTLLLTRGAALIVEAELRNGEVSTVHTMKRWLPGDPPTWQVFADEPVSTVSVRLFEESTGALLGEQEHSILRSIVGAVGVASGTMNIRDPWARRLEQKGGSSNTQLAAVNLVQRVSHTMPMTAGGGHGRDPWVPAGQAVQGAVDRLREGARGLFLPRDTAVEEAEAFSRIRELFDKPHVGAVSFIDPFFNADGLKLLLRLRQPLPFRVLTSLRAEAWSAFREQLRGAALFLPGSITIHQAKGHPGDQLFHDRYLVVERDSIREVYVITNSFAALGAKHPIVVTPASGELAVRIEDYVERLFAEAGDPWWPESQPQPRHTVPPKDDTAKALGGRILAGVLGEPGADPRATAVRAGAELVWQHLARWLSQPAIESPSARHLLNFVAGHLSGIQEWDGAASTLRTAGATACSVLLARCVDEELGAIDGRGEDHPPIHRHRLRPLAELVRRSCRDDKAQLFVFRDILSLCRGFGPPYDRRYGARLALRLLSELNPSVVRELVDRHFAAAKAREAAKEASGDETDIADEPTYLRAASLYWYLIDDRGGDNFEIFRSSKTLLLRQLAAAALFVGGPGSPDPSDSAARVAALADWSEEERVAVLLAVAEEKRGPSRLARNPCVRAIVQVTPESLSRVMAELLSARRGVRELDVLAGIAEEASISRPEVADAIRADLLASFEVKLSVPRDGASVSFHQGDLEHLAHAVDAILERSPADVATYGREWLRRFRRTVARLEHPRATSVHAVEWRTRMAVGSLHLCYLLTLAEQLATANFSKGLELAVGATDAAASALAAYLPTYASTPTLLFRTRCGPCGSAGRASHRWLLTRPLGHTRSRPTMNRGAPRTGCPRQMLPVAGECAGELGRSTYAS